MKKNRKAREINPEKIQENRKFKTPKKLVLRKPTKQQWGKKKRKKRNKIEITWKKVQKSKTRNKTRNIKPEF